MAEVKLDLEKEIEEMRSSRQLNEEFARKVEQLSATSDRLNFELFRKNEIREAIKETAVSIKSVSWGV